MLPSWNQVMGRTRPAVPVLRRCSVAGCDLELVRWADPEGRCLVCFFKEFEESYPAMVLDGFEAESDVEELDMEFRGKRLPEAWTPGAAGRVYVRYRLDGKGGIIRLLSGNGGNGWEWKAERMLDGGDAWLPLAGSGAAFPIREKAQDAADAWLYGAITG